MAAFLADETGRILLIRRAKDPGKGKLGPPGGFVDVNETAEIAVRREVKEEVNLDILGLRYLASFPNEYLSHGRIWPVLDLFFTARVRAWSELAALDEVESYVLRDPAGVSPAELAFPSMVAGLQAYNASNGLTVQQTDA